MKTKKDLSIYIHVPFCVKKCAYCDFLSGPSNETTMETYFHALTTEIKSSWSSFTEYMVTTIYFGGGTPSSVSPKYIKNVMELIYGSFNVKEDVEITIEINPGTVNKKKLFAYKECGINRISFGLQAANNEELKLLGRIHTYEEFENNYFLARAIGFKNISVDLMSAIPGQTTAKFLETLKKVVKLNPEHISSYSLIIEEGTPFYERYSEHPECLPSEDEDREIYKETKCFLKQNGYERYEISNYAKHGFESRHNSIYWTRGDYIGFGLGASSLVENVRFKNIESLDEYIECSNNAKQRRTQIEILDKKHQMEEFMFLGLRKTEGISIKLFLEEFNCSIYDVYGSHLEKLKLLNLIEMENDKVRLTEDGIDVSNQVFIEFLL